MSIKGNKNVTESSSTTFCFIGHRKDVKKVCLLVTDGKQNPPNFDPVAESQQLYDSGTEIFVVGFGDVDREGLTSIARDPKKVFIVSSVDDINKLDFVKRVTEGLCKGELLFMPSKHKGQS